MGEPVCNGFAFGGVGGGRKLLFYCSQSNFPTNTGTLYGGAGAEAQRWFLQTSHVRTLLLCAKTREAVLFRVILRDRKLALNWVRLSACTTRCYYYYYVFVWREKRTRNCCFHLSERVRFLENSNHRARYIFRDTVARCRVARDQLIPRRRNAFFVSENSSDPGHNDIVMMIFTRTTNLVWLRGA